MCDLCDAIPYKVEGLCDVIKPYTVGPPLHRKNLTSPPRTLRPGERWDGTQILYSSGWINSTGEVVPFEAPV